MGMELRMHLDTPLQEPVSDGLVYFLALKMAAANVKGKQKCAMHCG